MEKWTPEEIAQSVKEATAFAGYLRKLIKKEQECSTPEFIIDHLWSVVLCVEGNIDRIKAENKLSVEDILGKENEWEVE